MLVTCTTVINGDWVASLLHPRQRERVVEVALLDNRIEYYRHCKHYLNTGSTYVERSHIGSERGMPFFAPVLTPCTRLFPWLNLNANLAV